MSNSYSTADQKQTTTQNTTNTDKRVGVSGNSNVTATEGSTINVESLDKDLALAAYEAGAEVIDIAVRSNAATSQAAMDSAQESARVSASVAAKAIDANEATLDTSLRAGVAVSSAAIAAAQESARVAAAASAQAAQSAVSAAQESARVASSAILAGQDRSLESVDRSVALAAGVASDATANARAIVLANNELTEKTREGGQELVKLVADKLSTAVADERKNINAELVGSVAKWGSVAAVGLALVLGVSMALKKHS